MTDWQDPQAVRDQLLGIVSPAGAEELAKGSMTTSETNINNDRVIVRNIEFLFPLGHRFADYFLESGYSGANLVQSRFA